MNLTKVIGIPMENTGKHCNTTVNPETFSMGNLLNQRMEEKGRRKLFMKLMGLGLGKS